MKRAAATTQRTPTTRRRSSPWLRHGLTGLRHVGRVKGRPAAGDQRPNPPNPATSEHTGAPAPLPSTPQTEDRETHPATSTQGGLGKL